MKPLPLVTLTLSPSLDLSWESSAVVSISKIRTEQTRVDPGGGGINVSRVLQRFDCPTLAVVALGGVVGQKIEQILKNNALAVQRIQIENETRQNMTVLDKSSGAQYRFVLPGAEIRAQELAEIEKTLLEHTPDGSIVIISGSFPAGVDDGFLTRLCTKFGPNSRLIVDSSGQALQQGLQCGAYLVKPSARELANIVGQELQSETDILQAVNKLMAQSNVEVLVASIGAGGAMLATRDGKRYRLYAPAVKVRSAVGAGDSMIAGIATALQQGHPILEAVVCGIAYGTAAVLTEGTELCRPEDVVRLTPLVKTDLISS